ncbi:MAG: acetamidase/formamidase family protein, partial [Acidobacteria bacterium]|nr:acetamidase/formamidase family protein [Acidobacteriota bacterium]
MKPTIVAAAAPCGAETHRLTPTRFHNTFASAHAPILRARPGDRVIAQTIDARGYDLDDRKIGERSNPQIGPFFVEGAEPGDVLVVQMEKIEPNRATAWSDTLLAPHTADPAFFRFTGLHEQQMATWHIAREKRVAWTELPGMRPARITVPLRPMLGCVATAPANKEAIHTSTPDPFGGNIDYNGMVAGAKLMLPVSERGAALVLGHALRYDIANIMDPHFTVAAKIP